MTRLDAKAIGDRLSEYLKIRDRSIRYLHREVERRTGKARGSSYGAIRDYVEGRTRYPRRDVLEACAEVLQVRPEWLLEGDGEPTERTEEVAAALKAGIVKEKVRAISAIYREGGLIEQSAPYIHQHCGATAIQFLHELIVRMVDAAPAGEMPTEEQLAALSAAVDSLAGKAIETLRPGQELRALPLSLHRHFSHAFLHALTLVVPGPGEGQGLDQIIKKQISSWNPTADAERRRRMYQNVSDQDSTEEAEDA